MPVFNPSINQTDLNAIRYQIETVGWYEYTVVANNFDDSPAVLATIDGVSSAGGATFPVPPDCTVTAYFFGAVYSDESTDAGQGFSFFTVGFRDGTGNVVSGETINATTTVSTMGTEFSTTTGDTVVNLTFAAAADTTNQGIDVTVAGPASSAGYLVARVLLVCAKKGGFYKAYRT